MYPTVFILQNLQAIVGAKTIRQRTVTADTRAFLASVTREDLFKPQTWRKLNRIALVRPKGDILPVRMRLEKYLPGTKIEAPLTITATPFTSSCPRWYTLADLVAAKLLGDAIPDIVKAIEFSAGGANPDLHAIDFLGTRLDPAQQIMATVIEERNRAKSAEDDPDAKRRELAMKVLGASGAYGIFAEINVSAGPSRTRAPGSRVTEAVQGLWWSDMGPKVGGAHDERPGRFFSPLVASLVTGGARLMLALAELEVNRRGGTFAFCDTDSLAIVAGPKGPPDIPRLSEADVNEISADFDPLSPYDRELVPHLLKREYAKVAHVQCYAVSAKRYVLFTRDKRNRLRIVKASESGLGAMLGRTPNETVSKLARRVWTHILIRELHTRYRGLRKQRMARLLDFHVPMRRKFPIAQPSILDRKAFKDHNRAKSYDFRMKPFSFLQTVTPAVEMRGRVRPVAPYERDVAKSRRLRWTDLGSGDPVQLDWEGTVRAGTVPVMRMDEFIDGYGRHPESKAAGPDGLPAGPETRGVLGRLQLSDREPSRIGKEVDRLDEDDGAGLEAPETQTYGSQDDEKLAWAIQTLGDDAAGSLAASVRVSERRLRDVLKGRSKPRPELRAALIRLANCRREQLVECDDSAEATITAGAPRGRIMRGRGRGNAAMVEQKSERFRQQG
jgi:hypothetical protein